MIKYDHVWNGRPPGGRGYFIRMLEDDGVHEYPKILYPEEVLAMLAGYEDLKELCREMRAAWSREDMDEIQERIYEHVE